MRPHRLRLSAFGPFAGEVDVDFDQLAAGGLFLLQGDTGAGKTSILDGLAFALYGKVPGQRSGVGRLRSDHADPALRTRVELEATIAGRRLRIQRWPEQERRKQRGSGTTRDPAKVLLQEAVDGGWVTVSTRVGEADAELGGLLGMSADQFHQVVLLPQGEFARFLRSDAAERARLLQRLFATDRFRRVEDWLAECRRTRSAELEAASSGVLRLAARVAQAAGVEEPPAPDGAPPAGWARDLAEAATRTAADREVAAEAARVAQADAETLLGEARELQRRQQRKADLLHRRSRLEQGRPAVSAALLQIDSARRAAVLRSGLEQLTRRRAQAERFAGEVLTHRSAIGPQLAGATPAELREAAEQCRRALGRLDSAQRVENDLQAERARHVSALEAGASAAREAAGRRAELATLPDRRRRLAAELEAIDALRLRIPLLEADAARLDRAGRDARARNEAVATRRRRAEELLSARENAVELREEATRLRTERVDSMIAELSAALVDGNPCPVCGAIDHPDPSDVRGSRVSREQEDAARNAAEQAQQVVADIAAAVARSDAEIEGLDGRLADAGQSDRTPDAIDTAAREAARELAAARRAAPRVDEVTRTGRALEEAEREQSEALNAALRAEQVQSSRAADSATRVGELHSQLVGLLGGAENVGAARRREQRAAQAIDLLLGSLERAAVADEELRAAESAVSGAVAAAGFANAAEAEAALLPADTLEALQARVDEARSAEAAVLAALEEPDVDVDLGAPAAVEACEAVLRVARDGARAALAAAAAARTRATDLAGLAPEFEGQVLALEPLRRRASEARQLADLAGGQGANRLRMTLSAYVLAARLEEVAAVASERLRRMTQGRYTLVHTDAGRGGARAGLGLLARDTWTGQDRDTATLSGGETFLASLALALALGDVVTAESGGADIEALFVDEGFGSLDEETLEEVMDTLDNLREGGRMVGLVSHVGELRARIPAQIQVRKGRHGSSVEVRPG